MGQQSAGQRCAPLNSYSCRPLIYACIPENLDQSYIESVRIEDASEYHQVSYPASGLVVMSKFREERPLRGIDGGSYKGQWIGSTRDGYGVQHYQSSAVYHGEWLKDQRHGMGSFDHANGDMYCGEWQAGVAHGDGVFSSTDGSKYEGEWINNRQHGKGKEEDKHGATFEGLYDDGYKSGPGKFKFSDGSSYEGQMSRNQFSGEGKFDNRRGRQYEGQWSANKMNGHGKFKWEDGKTYEGQYKDDRKNGTGTFTFTDGRSYEGEWRKGKMHGQGCWRVASEGKERHGTWKAGRFKEWIDGGPEDRDLDMEQSLSRVSRRGSESEEVLGRGAKGSIRGAELHSNSSKSNKNLSFTDGDTSTIRSSDSSNDRRSARSDTSFDRDEMPSINEGFELGEPSYELSPMGGSFMVAPQRDPTTSSVIKDPTTSSVFRDYPQYTSTDDNVGMMSTGIITAAPERLSPKGTRSVTLSHPDSPKRQLSYPTFNSEKDNKKHSVSGNSVVRVASYGD